MKKSTVIRFENSTPSAIPTKAELEFDLVELPEFAELVDGVYQVTVTDGVATWTEAPVSPIPAAPANDGLTYHLTVVDGVYAWVVVA